MSYPPSGRLAGGPAERPVPVRGDTRAPRAAQPPNRLQRVLTRRPPGPARPPLNLDDMERAGFLLLGESPGHEIVFGTVVQPWKAITDDEPATQAGPARFAAFDTPGTSRSPSTSE